MNLGEKFDHVSACVADLIQAAIAVNDLKYTSEYNQKKEEYDNHLASREARLSRALRSLLHTS